MNALDYKDHPIYKQYMSHSIYRDNIDNPIFQHEILSAIHNDQFNKYLEQQGAQKQEIISVSSASARAFSIHTKNDFKHSTGATYCIIPSSRELMNCHDPKLSLSLPKSSLHGPQEWEPMTAFPKQVFYVAEKQGINEIMRWAENYPNLSEDFTICIRKDKAIIFHDKALDCVYECDVAVAREMTNSPFGPGQPKRIHTSGWGRRFKVGKPTRRNVARRRRATASIRP